MIDVDGSRQDEVRALAELAFEEVGKAVTGVGTVHRAISDRVFSGVQLGVGPWAAPSRIIHNAIADGTYRSIAVACEVAAQVASRTVDGRGRVPSETKRGAIALGALTGLIGDALAEQDSPLATPMSLRVDGRIQHADSKSLAKAYPHATPKLVFFTHGLMETEVAWGIGGRPTYGARLSAELGFSELQVRYNTGRHISENGRDLAVLIEDVVRNWPVPVEEIVLVGHSMGGLVARSACHGASLVGAGWAGKVRHIVCLGSPHLGAPLARTVHTATALLQMLPESRPIGRLLHRRSAGIRDLYAGSLVDEDWTGRDLDALRQAAIAEVPLLADAEHSFVSASITRDPEHLLGRYLGDGLVLHVSARGRDKLRDIGFRDDDGMHLGSAHHFTLLNNEAVYEWLATRLREKSTPVG
ncbi:alpha/beta fold hydrolase [Williamsia sp. DF01-3]|uniref:PGAP1-like alpha/beta domain-containing protein n=1 Tax=Williamsia sp. DF01-3 TaxID=2934157 RepID=UPI001FF5E936|nr:alpha/beta fold hydrolase [Williamsia sp. DF01-3]MCK0518893.1 alpha/beta fold hydrolase [Williamsia sp. DF01-3]